MSSEAALEPGSLIDKRFKIERLLGRGGYGEVYLASQLSMQRLVALKVLHTTAATEPRTIERFQNEARWACQLNHPNTVTYYDFGFDEAQGLIYLVMEYLAGETLGERLKRQGPLSVEELTAVLEQVCGSLAEAHSLGLVHRDIKPENIMLIERAGRANYVKVIDFGIAKALEPLHEHDARSELTATGAIIGSPHYMAPEQIRSGEFPVDRRADIYALGCLVFKALTGVPPFRGRSPMDIATRHLLDPPPRLADMGTDQSFPPALEALVRRALSKDAEQRPTTAVVFFEELLEAVQVGGAATPPEVMASGVTPRSGRLDRPTVIGIRAGAVSGPVEVEVNLPGEGRSSGETPRARLASTPAPEAEWAMSTPAPRDAVSLADERMVNTMSFTPAAAPGRSGGRRWALIALSGGAAVLILGGGAALTAKMVDMGTSDAVRREADAGALEAPPPEVGEADAGSAPEEPVGSTPPLGSSAARAPGEGADDAVRQEPGAPAAPRSARGAGKPGTREVLGRVDVGGTAAASPPGSAAEVQPVVTAEPPRPAAPVRVSVVVQPWGRIVIGERSADSRLEVELKPGRHTVVIEQYGKPVHRQAIEVRPDKTSFVIQIPR